MKPSNLQTPRTLGECHFQTGYTTEGPRRESLKELLAGYALAIAIGVGLAACLFYGWSA